MLFHDYYREALRLQKVYASEIKILIGVEVDWIRPSSKDYISNLLRKYSFELFIGSVHHVHTKPTDYDHALYAAARNISGGSDEKVFEDYFDLQYEMLRALKPPIVGHFDVIRLKADNPNGSLMHWPGVWHKILRNLDLITEYGGIMELNSAALRKGLSEPYPKAEICRVRTVMRNPTLQIH
jgi:histidinol-phosphatase (PHP family)